MYLLRDVDRGDDLLDWTPNAALPEILRQGRTPLTISEGISWLLQDPSRLDSAAVWESNGGVDHGGIVREGGVGGPAGGPTAAAWLVGGSPDAPARGVGREVVVADAHLVGVVGAHRRGCTAHGGHHAGAGERLTERFEPGGESAGRGGRCPVLASGAPGLIGGGGGAAARLASGEDAAGAAGSSPPGPGAGAGVLPGAVDANSL